MGQVISDLVEDQPRLAQIALAGGLAQVLLQRPGDVPLHILHRLIQGLQGRLTGLQALGGPRLEPGFLFLHQI